MLFNWQFISRKISNWQVTCFYRILLPILTCKCELHIPFRAVSNTTALRRYKISGFACVKIVQNDMLNWNKHSLFQDLEGKSGVVKPIDSQILQILTRPNIHNSKRGKWTHSTRINAPPESTGVIFNKTELGIGLERMCISSILEGGESASNLGLILRKEINSM